MNHRVEFFDNKQRLAWLLFFALVFDFVCLYMFISGILSGEVTNISVCGFRGPCYIWLVGAAGSLLFSLGVYIFIKQLLNKQPVIVANEQGVLLRDFCFLPWSEIIAIEVRKISTESYIVFDLIDGNVYSRQFSPVKKFFAECNMVSKIIYVLPV